MHLLYYWRGDNYRRDLDWGAGFNLNQANPLLHQISVGESLWAFTRTGDGRYVLAAQLVIAAKTLNAPGFRYGKYRVWGSLKLSRYFNVESQPNAEHLIRNLSCKANAKVLGRAFQGHAAVRRLTSNDHQLLNDFAKSLPAEPRAKLLPEERLEAAVLLGDHDELARLVVEDQPGIANQRREYLFKKAPVRNRELVLQLRELYGGCCQVTGWNPRKSYGLDLCEAHHMPWLSRGGEDALQNLILISPNLHRAIHVFDAPFDYADGAFVFGQARESLHANKHIDLRRRRP